MPEKEFMRKYLRMPSATLKPTRRTTSGFIGKTDVGLPFVEVPSAAGKPFAVSACDRILKKHGARPLTATERKEFAKFLHP
jgi:hypothetical protein